MKNFNRLSFKIFIYSSMIAVVVVGAIAYVTQLEIEKALLNQEKMLSRVGADSVQRRSIVNHQKLQIAVSQIVNNNAIIEAFAKRDRDEIARLTSPLMDDLTAVNIDVFNYYLPDNTVFYQGNKQVKYKNDSLFQQSVIEVNQNNRPIIGLEYGKSGLAFTHISPVFYDNTYIGAVELGLPFDHRILNIFERISGGEWFIFSTDGERDILLSATTDKEPFVRLPRESIQNMLQGESVFLNMKPYLLEAIPLEDYAGNVRWYVMRIFDNTQAIQKAAQQRNRIIGFGLIITLLGFSTIFILMFYLLKPLGYLVEKAKALTAGDLNQEIKVKTKDEIGKLAATMEKMRQSIIAMACYDPLTNLANRKLFMERLPQEVSRSRRNGKKLALLYLDLDKFKEINDNFGHEVGDRVLCEVGNRLLNLIRESDMVFRLGGDEIVVMLCDLSSKEDAILVIDKISEALKVPFLSDDKLIFIRGSLGLSLFPDDSNDPEELLKKADNAMYNVKRAGGNSYI